LLAVSHTTEVEDTLSVIMETIKLNGLLNIFVIGLRENSSMFLVAIGLMFLTG